MHACTLERKPEAEQPICQSENHLGNMVKLQKPLWKIKTGVCTDHKAEQLLRFFKSNIMLQLWAVAQEEK